MKKLSSLILGLALLTGLTACDPISGTLRVVRSFSAMVGTNKQCTDQEYPCIDQPRQDVIPVGSHSMTISRFGGNLIQINLRVHRDTKVIELKLPRGKDIPATGDFTLSSGESGQPFDLFARTQTDVSRTGETFTEEDCQVPYQEYVCGVVGNPAQHKCWYETRYRPGLREVSFYHETTTQNMTAQLAQNGAQLADFSGSRSDTRKVYTFQGECRPRYW